MEFKKRMNYVQIPSSYGNFLHYFAVCYKLKIPKKEIGYFIEEITSSFFNSKYIMLKFVKNTQLRNNIITACEIHVDKEINADNSTLYNFYTKQQIYYPEALLRTFTIKTLTEQYRNMGPILFDKYLKGLK